MNPSTAIESIAPSPTYKPASDLTRADIMAMNASWIGPPLPYDPGRIVWKEVHFATAGGLVKFSDPSEWHSMVVSLLNGTLDPSIAPCAIDYAGLRGDVRSITRHDIRWDQTEPREWITLERAGLRRAVAQRLQAGIIEAPPTEALTPAQQAARTLLEHVSGGTVTERLAATSELVREAIYADALARANGSRARAAELLGVAAPRVTEALRAYPALAAQWPAGPRGRKPSDDEAR